MVEGPIIHSLAPMVSSKRDTLSDSVDHILEPTKLVSSSTAKQRAERKSHRVMNKRPSKTQNIQLVIPHHLFRLLWRILVIGHEHGLTVRILDQRRERRDGVITSGELIALGPGVGLLEVVLVPA